MKCGGMEQKISKGILCDPNIVLRKLCKTNLYYGQKSL